MEENLSDQDEIREGVIICNNCSEKYEITDGILNLLIKPTQEIIAEQKGWAELEKMVINTDELMLS